MTIRKFVGTTGDGVKTSYTAIDDKDDDRIVFAIAVTFKGELIMVDKRAYKGKTYHSPGQSMPSSKIIELSKGKQEIIDLIFNTTSITTVSR